MHRVLWESKNKKWQILKVNGAYQIVDTVSGLTDYPVIYHNGSTAHRIGHDMDIPKYVHAALCDLVL